MSPGNPALDDFLLTHLLGEEVPAPEKAHVFCPFKLAPSPPDGFLVLVSSFSCANNTCWVDYKLKDGYFIWRVLKATPSNGLPAGKIPQEVRHKAVFLIFLRF